MPGGFYENVSVVSFVSLFLRPLCRPRRSGIWGLTLYINIKIFIYKVRGFKALFNTVKDTKIQKIHHKKKLLLQMLKNCRKLLIRTLVDIFLVTTANGCNFVA